ncbi:MAG: putative Xaa-Pro dipeptidase [Deltaproteobacteria bacterium]|nr:putative Xaa-Pro dipeptidase [Deltaproteobacteria bacterium]
MEKVPAEEIHQRLTKFQADLATHNLDGALLFQNVDIFYFSGTIQSSILFIPRESDPILMVQKGLQRVREESPLKNILAINGKRNLNGTLHDFGIRRIERVGLEMDVLPAHLYLWLGESFPQCRFEDVSGLIRKQRMIKSPYETDQIRKAAAILHQGYMEIQGFIKEGVSELEIDGRLAFIARREGHMGILRMRGWNQEMTYAHVLSGESGSVVSFLNSPHGGSGNTPAMAQGAGFRRIRRNEPIGIDYGVGINGYLADQFRTFVIGALSPELERAHQCSRDIHDLFAREAKPGIPCPDLYAMAKDFAQGAGLSDCFMGHGEGQVRFVGHGIGLEIDEFPVIAPNFEEKLAQGMVMAFEPKFVFPGKGVVGMEDDYVVTSSGVERLTLTEQVLIKLKP